MSQFASREASGKGEATMDTWGTKGYLVMEQNEALIEFLDKVNKADLDLAKFKVESLENAALRFLRARQFSVPNALELLAKCVEKKNSARAHHFATLSEDECMHCDAEASSPAVRALCRQTTSTFGSLSTQYSAVTTFDRRQRSAEKI
jgi:hypothetical protein